MATVPGKLTTTAQKMKFSIKDLFSKCEQIRRKPDFFCAVNLTEGLFQNIALSFVIISYVRGNSVHTLYEQRHSSTHENFRILLCDQYRNSIGWFY